MKKLICNNSFYFISVMLSLLSGTVISAQEKEDPVKRYVTLNYYNNNNHQQFLLLSAISKNSQGIQPQQNKTFKLYIDSNDPVNLIGNLTTDKTGKAKAFIPPAMKTTWEATSKHFFLAIADEGTDEEQSQEIEITKSKISIDTLNEEGTRSVTASIMKLEGDVWVPAPEVEMKIGIRRLGGILSAGDEVTYTTDSSGSIAVEVTKENIPGDEKGNIILVAKVDNNDELGNLLIEKTVSWGVPESINKTFFDQRTLWSTRNRTPFWLLFMAYSIVIAVWGTLIYLIFELIKIKRLGKKAS